EDRVVLARPATTWLATIVICPDELIEKAVSAEHGVEKNLCIVGFAIVQVQVERAVVSEQSPCLDQAWLKEPPVVLKPVIVGHEIPAETLIADALESGERSRRRTPQCGRRLPRLLAARVERWIE